MIPIIDVVKCKIGKNKVNILKNKKKHKVPKTIDKWIEILKVQINNKNEKMNVIKNKKKNDKSLLLLKNNCNIEKPNQKQPYIINAQKEKILSVNIEKIPTKNCINPPKKNPNEKTK